MIFGPGTQLFDAILSDTTDLPTSILLPGEATSISTALVLPGCEHTFQHGKCLCCGCPHMWVELPGGGVSPRCAANCPGKTDFHIHVFEGGFCLHCGCPDPWRVVPSRPSVNSTRVDPMLASDAERDICCSSLNDAFAAGRLSRSTHESRLERALKAETRGDLAGLLTDIPATKSIVTKRTESVRRPVLDHCYLRGQSHV